MRNKKNSQDVLYYVCPLFTLLNSLLSNVPLIKLIILSQFLLAVRISAQGYICAMGGGAENYNDWSDKPYRWIVEKSGRGKIIILSVNDETSWIPDYFTSLGALQAYNKKISSQTIANLQTTYDELVTAKAIFIKGGDQWNYVNLWKGTRTQDAIKKVFRDSGVIAGTSAGAMILGDVVFSAKLASPTSKECLQNPFSNNITLENNFLNLVQNTIFDSHLVERGRLFRLVSFLLKSHFQYSKDILGIGIDDKTAFCIDNNGIGKVMGSASVSIVQKDRSTIYINDLKGYLIQNLKCDQLVQGWSYDLLNRKINDIPSSAKPVDSSRSRQSSGTDIWLTGSNDPLISIYGTFLEFLNNYHLTNLTFIYDKNFDFGTIPYITMLNSLNIEYFNIEISPGSLNDNNLVYKMNGAQSFCVFSKSLEQLSALSDTTTLVGKTFWNKIHVEHKPCYFIGNAGKLCGEFFINNVDIDQSAAYLGLMTNNRGLNIFGDLIFQPLYFDNSNYYENRTASLFWGLTLNRKRLGIYLDDPDCILISQNSIINKSASPLMIIDSRNCTLVDSSTYHIEGYRSTRQAVAMNNILINISTLNNTYFLENGNFGTLNFIGKKPKENKNIFNLSNNFPNPFNSSTNINFYLPGKDHVKIVIYDLLGRIIFTLVDEDFPPGNHNIRFDVSLIHTPIPSGIYFLKIITRDKITSNKMVLLK